MIALPTATLRLFAQLQPPADGGYVSIVKLVLFVIGAAAWLVMCQWIDKDCARLHLKRHIWNGVAVGGGLIGLTLWLVLPWFAVGMILFIVLAGGAGYGYVWMRNQVVHESSRVLTPGHFKRMFGGGEKAPRVEVTVALADAKGEPIGPPPQADPLFEGFVSAQSLLADAVSRRAERIALAPAGQEVQIQYSIDGVNEDVERVDRRTADLCIGYLKQSAGLDVNDHRRPQQGKLRIQDPERRLELRLRTSGSRAGESLVITVTDPEHRPTLSSLGMNERQLAELEEFRKSEAGVLITGVAAGAGSTTTFYEMLRAHDAFMTNIQTLEQEPEQDLENITQHSYDPANLDLEGDEAPSFARALQSIVRRGPDVIGVSLCKDKETAQLIAQSAMDRTKYYVQMAGKDTFTLLARWAALVGDLALAMAPLRVVFSQTLIRKLCPDCREGYRPDPEMLRKINLPAERIEKLYRPPTQPLVDEHGKEYTCPKCQGTGYFGRTAVFEVLTVDDELRRLVINNASAAEIKQHCRARKMLYLQEEALRKVIAGETSINEVLRVFRESK